PRLGAGLFLTIWSTGVLARRIGNKLVSGYGFSHISSMPESTLLSAAALHAQLLHFLVVVLAVQNVPFLAALEDGSLLILDFMPRRLIDLLFPVQHVFQNLAHFQPDRIPVLDKIQIIHLRQSVGDHVRYLIYFVTADSHSTALYLRTSSFFTLRNISW